MRDIDQLVVHCAATRPDQDIGVAEIDAEHRAQGWDCIGYHYVIRRSGILEKGRPDSQVGAHVKGHNAFSLGICLVGGVDAHDVAEKQFHTRAIQHAHRVTQAAARILSPHRDSRPPGFFTRSQPRRRDRAFGMDKGMSVL
jgi:hypothetical protein